MIRENPASRTHREVSKFTHRERAALPNNDAYASASRRASLHGAVQLSRDSTITAPTMHSNRAAREAAGSAVNVSALLSTSVPSLMLRGERHTGTNFLDAIIQYNFKRAPEHQWSVAALATPLRARKCYHFFGVSTPCVTCRTGPSLAALRSAPTSG